MDSSYCLHARISKTSYYCSRGKDVMGAPNGPSTSARTCNCPPGAARTALIILSVSPRRLWMRSDIVVVVFDIRHGFIFSHQPLDNGVEVSVDVHATENGWDIHHPIAGIYRYMYWPALNFQGRAMDTSTRATSPGRIRMVAFVISQPLFRQMMMQIRYRRWRNY